MQPFKKIVVIGPESTGKSTLCEMLAEHFKTKWVSEYAREFLLAKGNHYTYEDLLTIAKGQLAQEERISGQWAVGNLQPGDDSPLKSHVSSLTTHNSQFTSHVSRSSSQSPLLFIDTDMWVMKVWCEFVFEKCHQWILDQIVERNYDLYLLCNTDLPWVKDELREYPDLETREKLFHIYKDILVNQSTPWVEIKGQAEERLRIAIEAVESLVDDRW